MENYQKQIIKWFSSPMAGKSYIFNIWSNEQKTQKILREKVKNNKIKGLKANYIIIEDINNGNTI